jgi:hypothetical protein
MVSQFSVQNPNEWYQKSWIVHLLLVLFFPVGLYALWKNTLLPKWWKITATVFIAIIFINVAANKEKYKTNNFKNNLTEETSTIEQSTPVKEEKLKEPEKPIIVLPQSQLSFIDAVESFYSPYNDAPNELKKSALRTHRKDAIKNILSNRRINEWVGTLTDMQTNSEGRAIVEIKLEGAESIVMKTWNNALSDFMDNTLIENGSDLYNSISELSEGGKVVFSGTLISDDRDYVKEGSMTESGSMTDPEFIVKFSSIRKK